MSVLPTVLPELPPAGPAPRRTAPAPVRRAPLFLVPPLVKSQARRAPFVLLVVGLLTAGLVGLLLLNTVLAQGAFQVHDLTRQQAALSDSEQSLARRADALNDPGSLALRAAKLGMVPTTQPSFLAPGQKLPAGARVIAGGLAVVPAPKAAAPALTLQQRLAIQARQRAAAQKSAAQKSAAQKSAAQKSAAQKSAGQVATGGAR